MKKRKRKRSLGIDDLNALKHLHLDVNQISELPERTSGVPPISVERRRSSVHNWGRQTPFLNHNSWLYCVLGCNGLEEMF
ncbi:hypothetical protein BVRB_014750 [Beta vulgaris subsp. vulgaris]|uniref:Uncharacterized protein n=1 Tax=Beta vulgaris subsp. vulgaris TaxID=3555 RepID=A0A0J8B1H4_BETVV|nr:hypothetical protein BVRB_014750 [Beta vulgaris subsp. vulgaris]